MAPRLNARKINRAAATAPPRPANEGDNSRAAEEAERVQLISFISRLADADAEIERAKGPLKAAQERRKSIINLAKAQKFTAKELESRMNEMKQSTKENAIQSAREARHRRWLGIISEEQAKMHLGGNTPEEARDEHDWEIEGYKAGLRNLPSSPPAECSPRFHQSFMRGHEMGFKSQLESLAQNAPKPPGVTAAEVAAQAAADFAEEHPEIDLDAEARKLKNSSFMERSSPDDGFEATEEELAGQKPRAAIQEATAQDEVV